MTAVTVTPKDIRPHIVVAELEDMETGYRYWTPPMQGGVKTSQFLKEQEEKGHMLSDLTCSVECWCWSESE